MGIFGIDSERGTQMLTSDAFLKPNMATSGKLAETGNELEMAIKPRYIGIFGIGMESGSQILTSDAILKPNMATSG